MLSDEQANELKRWVGVRETVVDHATVPFVQRLSALLDWKADPPASGQPLPLGWHSALCQTIVRHSDLGEDGHPRRGQFIPPIPLQRRMAAGTRMQFEAELLVGDEVRRASTIEDVSIKAGRHGSIVILTIANAYYSPRGLAVRETQQAAFVDPPATIAADKPSGESAPAAAWELCIVPDPVMVFRYAALTFTGHRIHWDHAYATKVERHPAVLVSAGLNQLLLMELVRTRVPGRIKMFFSRNLRPLLVSQPMRLCGAPAPDGGARLWIVDEAGRIAVTAEVQT